MTVNFTNEKEEHIKSWPNWTGVVPQIGDTVILNFGDYNEIPEKHTVTGRVIDGKKPDKVTLVINWD
jgi:hypothetical protein